MTEPKTQQLADVDRRIAQLTARRERLQAVARARKQKDRRRIDTRCKIQLGAAFAALVKKRDPAAVRIYRELRAALPQKTAAAFVSWHADPLPDWDAEPVPDLDSGGSPGAT